MLAENIPNNGKHQWIVPEYGSQDVHFRLTIESGSATSTTITDAFNIFGNPTKIDLPMEKPAIQVFPNPGGDQVSIYDHQQIKKIVVLDLHGKICMERLEPGNTLDLKNLLPGVYFYRGISWDGTITTGKWIKK